MVDLAVERVLISFWTLRVVVYYGVKRLGEKIVFLNFFPVKPGFVLIKTKVLSWLIVAFS